MTAVLRRGRVDHFTLVHSDGKRYEHVATPSGIMTHCGLSLRAREQQPGESSPCRACLLRLLDEWKLRARDRAERSAALEKNKPRGRGRPFRVRERSWREKEARRRSRQSRDRLEFLEEVRLRGDGSPCGRCDPREQTCHCVSNAARHVVRSSRHLS